MKTLVFFSLLLISIINVYSQQMFQGRSQIRNFIELNELPVVNLQISDKKLQSFKIDKENALHLKKDLFAIGIDTNISPTTHGVWISTRDGKKIWSLAIQSDNAKSLGLVLNPFYLNVGAKLIISDAHQHHNRGAFTYRNNRESKIFTVTPIPSDYIIIELQLEAGISDYGNLTISRLFHEPSLLSGHIKSQTDRYYGTSAHCHTDINCVEDENIQQQKRAVVRLIFDDNEGLTRCSGTLINNTKRDGKPFVITAGHCIGNEYNAHTAVYYFDYEAPYCDGVDGEINSLSGSRIKGRSDYLDFALVEMYNTPPLNYRPLYSGWDSRGNTPESSYSIHHPEGDVKKVSIDNDRATIGSVNGFMPETHWLVREYETGTSETGSSGAGLFNEENLLVGTLTAGYSACTDTITDLYQMFHYSWDNFDEVDMQLKNWLDSSNTNLDYLINFDPAVDYHKSARFLTNYDTSLSLVKSANTVAWGYPGGHNYHEHTLYAEKFNARGTKYIDAIVLNPQKTYGATSYSSIDLIIWEGKNNPEKEVFRQTIYYFEMEENIYQKIQLKNWVKVDYDFFVGYLINYNYFQDTFALHVIDKPDNNTAFTYERGNWIPLKENNSSLESSLSIGVISFDYVPQINNPNAIEQYDEMQLYPNPAEEQVQIVIKDKIDRNFQVKLYNLQGQLMINKQFADTDINFPLDISKLAMGVYLVEVIFDDKRITRKLLKHPI